MKSDNPNNSTVYSLAWPMAMNAVLLQAILIIDTVLVGGLGEAALAAMGIATSIAGILIGILFAMSNGTQILAAQAFGAENNRALKSGYWSGMAIALLIAIIGCLTIFFLHDSIIGALAKDPLVKQYASTYLLIFIWVIIAIAISQNISVFFNATGKPKLPFFSKMVELPVNAAISYCLIYGYAGFPELGLAGAAIGSAVAASFRTVFLICSLIYFKYNYLLHDGWSGGRFSISIHQHLKNALPIAGNFISMSLAFTVCMMIYSQLAIHEFAALTVLFIWIRVAGMLINAWSQATGIIVGQVLGKDSLDNLDKFVSRSWRMVFFFALLVSLIYSTVPLLFPYIYPELKQQTVDVIWTLLPLLLLLPFSKASNTICGNILRAGGQAGYAFKVHVTVQWLFTVPMSLLFVLVLDVPVFWVFSLLLFEEIIKAIPFHLRMYSGIWKKRLVTD